MGRDGIVTQKDARGNVFQIISSEISYQSLCKCFQDRENKWKAGFSP
jgi:hypothetical protein